MKKVVALLLSIMMLLVSSVSAEGVDVVISNITVTQNDESIDSGDVTFRIGIAADEAENAGIRIVVDQDDASMEAILAVKDNQLIVTSDLLPAVYALDLTGIMEEVDVETPNEGDQDVAMNLFSELLPAAMNFIGNVEIDDVVEDADGNQIYTLAVSAEALNILMKDLKQVFEVQADAAEKLGLKEVVAALQGAEETDINLKGSLAIGESNIQINLDVLSADTLLANMNAVVASDAAKASEVNAADFRLTGKLEVDAFDGDEKIALLAIDGEATMLNPTAEMTDLKVDCSMLDVENGEPMQFTLTITNSLEDNSARWELVDNAGTFSLVIVTNADAGGKTMLLSSTLTMNGDVLVLSVLDNGDDTCTLAVGSVAEDGSNVFSAMADLSIGETDGAWMNIDTSNAEDLMDLLKALEEMVQGMA